MTVTLSIEDRAAKTRSQIDAIDRQLTAEFSWLPADTVHREVEGVSGRLLAGAHFTDHIAVLTGRFAAEHLRATSVTAPPNEEPG
jgi:hypothetical protein